MKDTALEKILKLLTKENHSTEEISRILDMPLGTVRSTLSILKRLGYVKLAGGKRGVPFAITEKGRGVVTNGP